MRLNHFPLFFALAFSMLSAEAVRFSLSDRALNPVDNRLFGQTVSSPSGGDKGMEAGLTANANRLQPSVIRALDKTRPPLLRFVCGLKAEKSGLRFLRNDFLRLCADLKAEPLVAIDIRDMIAGKMEPEAAAQAAAAVVFSCNGPTSPCRAALFELDCNPDSLYQSVPAAIRDKDSFYVQCVASCERAMRAADSSIRLLAPVGNPRMAILMKKHLGPRLDYAVEKDFMPGPITEIQSSCAHFSPASYDRREDWERSGCAILPPHWLKPDEAWYAWVAVPRWLDSLGRARMEGAAVSAARKQGWKTAVTEWNWNGAWDLESQKPLPDADFARGVGAAGYLHAFLRAGDAIRIACLSMAVGQRFASAGIRADPSSRQAAWMTPVGQALLFYNLHHGDSLYDLSCGNLPVYSQPFVMGDIRPLEKVALIDALVTASDTAVFFHAINRDFSRDIEITIDCSVLRLKKGRAVHYTLEGRLYNEPARNEKIERGRIDDRTLFFDGKTLETKLPKRSVSCIEIKTNR